MSLVFVAWLEMIDRWLAERWQSQRSQEQINLGGSRTRIDVNSIMHAGMSYLWDFQMEFSYEQLII